MKSFSGEFETFLVMIAKVGVEVVRRRSNVVQEGRLLVEDVTRTLILDALEPDRSKLPASKHYRAFLLPSRSDPYFDASV